MPHTGIYGLFGADFQVYVILRASLSFPDVMNGYDFNIQFRQDLQDYQDILGLVQQYLVDPVDPVKNKNSNAIKFYQAEPHGRRQDELQVRDRVNTTHKSNRSHGKVKLIWDHRRALHRSHIPIQD